MSSENENYCVITPFMKNNTSYAGIVNNQQNSVEIEEIVIINGIEYVQHGKLRVLKSFQLKKLVVNNDCCKIQTTNDTSDKIIVGDKHYFMLDEFGFIIEVNYDDIPREHKIHKNYKRYFEFLTNANNAFSKAFSYPEFNIDHINSAKNIKILRVCSICQANETLLTRSHLNSPGCNKCDKGKRILNKLKSININQLSKNDDKPLLDNSCCEECYCNYKVVIKKGNEIGCLCNLKWPMKT